MGVSQRVDLGRGCFGARARTPPCMASQYASNTDQPTRLFTNKPQTRRMGEPYKDGELLNKLYNDKDMTIPEIADELDCSPYSVHKYGKRNNIGIESRGLPDDHGVNDEELLRELHYERGMSVVAIANELDVSRATVKKRFKEFGIERQYKRGPKNPDAPIRTDEDGYERINIKNSVRVHRLVALLDNPAEDVFNGYDTQIHHKNGIPWDNRPENLEVVTASKHNQLHQDELNKDKKYTDKDTLEHLYHEEGMSQSDIAEKFGIKQTTVSSWFIRLGIDSKGPGRYKET